MLLVQVFRGGGEVKLARICGRMSVACPRFSKFAQARGQIERAKKFNPKPPTCAAHLFSPFTLTVYVSQLAFARRLSQELAVCCKPVCKQTETFVFSSLPEQWMKN